VSTIGAANDRLAAVVTDALGASESLFERASKLAELGFPRPKRLDHPRFDDETGNVISPPRAQVKGDALDHRFFEPLLGGLPRHANPSERLRLDA